MSRALMHSSLPAKGKGTKIFENMLVGIEGYAKYGVCCVGD
jgi:hypothetical protein